MCPFILSIICGKEVGNEVKFEWIDCFVGV